MSAQQCQSIIYLLIVSCISLQHPHCDHSRDFLDHDAHSQSTVPRSQYRQHGQAQWVQSLGQTQRRESPMLLYALRINMHGKPVPKTRGYHCSHLNSDKLKLGKLNWAVIMVRTGCVIDGAVAYLLTELIIIKK